MEKGEAHSRARNGALLSLALLGVLAGIYVWKPTPPSTPLALGMTRETLYPSQYSDEHITLNAIVSDPRFSRSVALRKESYLASVLSPIPKKRAGSASPERGTWLWTPVLDITPEYRTAIISGAAKNGIRVIYLSIDSYLDIFVMPEGPEKESRKAAFDAALAAFVREAYGNGLRVDAEAGWRNWAEPGHEYKAFAVLRYAMEYNRGRSESEQLRGFQYDIEPYLLPSYPEEGRAILRNLVALVNESVAELRDSDLEFSIVIPEFYDAASKETPRFFYGLRYAYTYDHLLNVLEQRPGSKIIVMAYRRSALGENGSIDIAKDEVATAALYETRVVIAQETGDSLPQHITFHGTSRAYYDEQIGHIEEAFGKERAFGGLATHYVNTFLSLE